MDYHIEVDEFTAAGELEPSGPIEWRDGEDCPIGFEQTGEIGDEFEAVGGEIFQEFGTGRVLVYLGVYGVRIPVMCSTRASFLRFAREWLAPLAELNRSATMDHLGGQIQDALEELAIANLPEAQPPVQPHVPPAPPIAEAN